MAEEGNDQISASELIPVHLCARKKTTRFLWNSRVKCGKLPTPILYDFMMCCGWISSLAVAWNILRLQSPPQLIHSLIRCLDMYGSVGNYWLKSKKKRKHEHQEITMKSKSVVDELPALPVR